MSPKQLADELEQLDVARKGDTIAAIRAAEREFATCVSKNLPTIIAALSAMPQRELLAEALEALEPFAESLVARTDVTHHSQDWREETDNTVVSIETSHQRKGMPDLSPDHTLWVGAFRRARAAADKIRAALTQEKIP